MTSLTSILSTCAHRILDAGDGKFTPAEVIECAQRDYPEMFDQERDRMAFREAGRIVKDILRGLTQNDSDQLALPGFRLPSAIFVRTPDGDYYTATRKAVWHELKAGEEERVRNVEAAQAKLDQFRDSMERLQPLMEPFPERTVEEAVELL